MRGMASSSHASRESPLKVRSRDHGKVDPKRVRLLLLSDGMPMEVVGVEGRRGAGGAIELWRTFPHTSDTTQATRGRPCLCRTRWSFSTIELHVFLSMALPAAERRRQLFHDNAIHCICHVGQLCRSANANANADALRTIKRRSVYRSPAVSAAAIRRY